MKHRLLCIVILVTILSACNSTNVNYGALVAPMGFDADIKLKKDYTSGQCKVFEPYTGELSFPSKYEGSGKARDVINTKAQAIYKAGTAPIYDFTKYLAKLSDKIYVGKGSISDYQCVIELLDSWAQAQALLDETQDSRGKAARKWTLAAISANYLKLNSLHQTQPNWSSQRDRIQLWMGLLAKQVMLDYSGRPLNKINNHDYWAAWAVMVTATVLNDKKLFKWAENVYKLAIFQLDDQGFWPNELRRATRAREYHNFAFAPIIAMASFLQANNKPVSADKLDLVANNLMTSIEKSILYENVTGIKQSAFDMKTAGRLAWLPIYASVSQNSQALEVLTRFPPKGQTRLGGHTRALYANTY